MCVLVVVGLVLTVIVWHYAGWFFGLVTLFLFVIGGAGWALLAHGLAWGIALVSPTPRKFRRAWRELDCSSELGEDHAAGYFGEWLEDAKPRGISAREFLLSFMPDTSEDESFATAWEEHRCDEWLGAAKRSFWYRGWVTDARPDGVTADDYIAHHIYHAGPRPHVDAEDGA
jgi:hypothetical protein